MRLRIFAFFSLLIFGFSFIGCNGGSKKASEEPVVQDLEIETGEAFNPGEKKDK